MAHIRRRKGGWQCIVRVQGYPPITKTFNTKIDAQRYSRDLENKLFREKHNIAKKKFPLMRDALIRYKDEVVVHKRSKDMETKLIGKHTLPEPIKLNLEPITKGRLLLEEMEADNKRLEEQRKKIFEKKQNDENIGGLAYLLNTNKLTHGSGFV